MTIVAPPLQWLRVAVSALLMPILLRFIAIVRHVVIEVVKSSKARYLTDSDR